ncbi:MAG: sodium/proline symporter PutP [Candidatus Aminicenantes bacterium]|nr:sodium/proline symporter PutP [Candidatus Aminicenantes bacterium]
MVSSNVGVLISFAVYLVFMMSIGWIFYKRTKNLSDYILGGRGLNTWVTSMSAQASDMSGWLLLGLPGAAYLAGMEAAWIAIGLAVGTYLNWKFVAKRLRKYTEIAGDSITLPDYFENRFRDDSRVLRIVSALFILIFFLIYTSSGFVAGAKLFSTVFNFSYQVALLIGALVIIIYTFLGGFMAVSWTDFFQGLIMFFAVLVVPAAAIIRGGGLNATGSAIKDINPELLDMFSKIDGSPIPIIVVISSLAWGLGYFGQPHILARFMAIRSADNIKKARWIAMVWVVISLTCAVVVGIVGRAYLNATPLAAGTEETVFMVMVNATAPPFIAGILLAAILAAVMSTADSQLLVTSSAISEDFYKVLFRKKASQKELVWVSRLAVIGVAIIAYVIGLDPDSSVLRLVAYAWAGFGATFGPLVILSLTWKRMTRNGALGGIIAGGVTVIAWKQLSGGIFDLYEIVPGFILSVSAIVVVSLLDKKPAKEIGDEFDSVSAA